MPRTRVAACSVNLRAALPWQRLHCDCILHMWQGVAVADHCAQCLPSPCLPRHRYRYRNSSLALRAAKKFILAVGFNPSAPELVFPRGAWAQAANCELEFNEIASFSSFVFIYLIPCWFEHGLKWNFRQERKLSHSMHSGATNDATFWVNP